jgi:hypothetical protein
MDLLKYRNEKDKKTQELIKEVLNSDVVQRYMFGSLAEMSLIRNLMLDKITKEKLKNHDDILKFDKIKESLKEFFYIEKIEQLEANDFIKYLTFNKDGVDMKRGGFFVTAKDGYIILKSMINDEKKNYWKISDKTPLFCKLTDNDKMVLVLMEKINL